MASEGEFTWSARLSQAVHHSESKIQSCSYQVGIPLIAVHSCLIRMFYAQKLAIYFCFACKAMGYLVDTVNMENSM